MEEHKMYEIGKLYKTHGGWKAKIIGELKSGGAYGSISTGLIIIHKPDERGKFNEYIEELKLHNSTGQCRAALSVCEPPLYDCPHPADLQIVDDKFVTWEED